MWVNINGTDIRMSPSQHHIWLSLNSQFRSSRCLAQLANTTPLSVRVTISHIRKKFTKAGLGASLIESSGDGYRRPEIVS